MWLKNRIAIWASNHSAFIIQCFLFWNYCTEFLRTLWRRWFFRSTKLVLPEYSAFYAKCVLYKPSIGIANVPYLLEFELHTEMAMPLITTNNTCTMYLYYNKDKNIILCNNSHPTDNATKATAKFINIVYSNSGKTQPLTLKLSHDYMQVGNEILSATHVLYLLRTQYETSEYVFDLNYQLKIMDNTFTITVINANQYLYLTASNKGFIVKDLEKNINIVY